MKLTRWDWNLAILIPSVIGYLIWVWVGYQTHSIQDEIDEAYANGFGREEKSCQPFQRLNAIDVKSN